jgi:hypothetical protein
MSGSPSSGGGGGPSPTGGDCGELRFQVSLTSPDPQVVPELQSGAHLSVQRTVVGTFATAVVAMGDGRRAGTIASGQLPDLLRCLEEGYQFRATVRNVLGGHVTVLVECVGKA